jgi:segregation and condensation protein B
MAQRTSQPRGSRTGVQAETPLEPDQLSQPDDQGLSLDDLGQAYAALLNKGADPYPQPDESAEEAPTAKSAEEEFAVDLPGADDAACDISPRSILEAMLFVGHPTGEPLTSERIAALRRGVRPAEIDDLVKQLNDEYAAEGAAYVILSVGPGYQLALRPELSPLRDHFYGRLREARLSQAAVDILAIVAYHQPIPAEQIDRLRGRPSGHILSQLVRRDLLRIDRPTDRKTKPTYATTTRFLDLFGLADLQELPRSQEIDREL